MTQPITPLPNKAILELKFTKMKKWDTHRLSDTLRVTLNALLSEC